MTYILKKKFFWLVFIIFNLLLFQSIYISAYFYFLSLLVLVFNILPLLNFYYNYKSINYIPLYYFTHLYFFCCYTLAIFFPEFVNSIFNNETFRLSYSSEIIQNKLYIVALEKYLLGLIFFNLGNYVVSKMLTKKIKQKNFFDFNDKYNELLLLCFLSYFGAFIFLFFGMLLLVPFVDTMTTMLNEKLPLAPGEWEMWGNPIKSKEYFEYILSYAPYNNLKKKDYPSMLITTSLFDNRVLYSEPVKYIARLRDIKNDSNTQLLKCKMEAAGHGGMSGRDNAITELAEEYSFILKSAKIFK